MLRSPLFGSVTSVGGSTGSGTEGVISAFPVKAALGSAFLPSGLGDGSTDRGCWLRWTRFFFRPLVLTLPGRR